MLNNVLFSWTDLYATWSTLQYNMFIVYSMDSMCIEMQQSGNTGLHLTKAFLTVSQAGCLKRTASSSGREIP